MSYSDGSPLAFILENNLVNENQKPLEFTSHRFMIDPLTDLTPDQVLLKCAQVGMSTNGILKAMWVAKSLGLNVIYTLPTQNVIKDFVVPKVDPIIDSNPFLHGLMGKTNSIDLKAIGKRFVYFRGAFSRSQAIMIAADVLIHDELDSSDQATITTFKSRLDASEYKWNWSWSNPTVPNFGVHQLWLESDQMHWFVECEACGHEWYIWFEMNDVCHFVDKTSKQYLCGNGECRRVITDRARQNGRWVPKFEGRKRRGYWVSQMIAPWISAEKIVEQQQTEPNDFLYNFVYGLPYQDADVLLDRASFINARGMGAIEPVDRVMGTDVGNIKHAVLGTPRGIDMIIKTSSWEELERIFLTNDVKYWVIDAMPDQVVPKRLAEKYRGRVFINYFVQDRKNLGIIRWADGDDYGVVQSDRTKLIDHAVSEINGKDIMFYMALQDMEELISHGIVLYRTVEENALGVPVPKWNTQENKPDHFFFALLYWRIALTKVLGGSGMVINPKPPEGSETKKSFAIVDGQSEGFTLDLAKLARNHDKPKGDWRTK